jgi:hypothetical protein
MIGVPAANSLGRMERSTDPAASTAERYRAFAEVEARGLCDCYEEWALGVADDVDTVALIDELPPAKRQPNLVFSAARFLGAPVSTFADFRGWLAANWDEVSSVCLTRSTQTNEPGRCATLLPALAAVPGPLALIEVGASAGLCLLPDQYSYRYHGHGESRMLHPESGPSTVLLDCELSGPVPLPDRVPEVVWRSGIDLNPLDVANTSDMEWLEALIWPEHHDRRVRLRAAIELGKSEPPELMRGDLVEDIEALVDQAPVGASAVVFHTAVLAYVAKDARQQFVDIMNRLQVTWLSNEGRGVLPGISEQLDKRALSARMPSDFVLSRNGEPIAFTQPHGRALQWFD